MLYMQLQMVNGFNFSWEVVITLGMDIVIRGYARSLVVILATLAY